MLWYVELVCSVGACAIPRSQAVGLFVLLVLAQFPGARLWHVVCCKVVFCIYAPERACVCLSHRCGALSQPVTWMVGVPPCMRTGRFPCLVDWSLLSVLRFLRPAVWLWPALCNLCCCPPCHICMLCPCLRDSGAAPRLGQQSSSWACGFWC